MTQIKIALISDIHGNLPALQAVLESQKLRDVDSVYCLGDLVGYYPYPNECVARIIREKIPSLLGNHDFACINDRPCRENAIGLGSQKLMRKLVSHKTTDFLSSLPRKIEMTIGYEHLYLVHGSPRAPLDGYVYEEDKVAIPKGVGLLAMGHTHKHFSRVDRGCLLINPGSVGQPREPIGGACFAIVSLPVKRPHFIFEPYDYSDLVSKTEALGFVELSESIRRNVGLKA